MSDEQQIWARQPGEPLVHLQRGFNQFFDVSFDLLGCKSEDRSYLVSVCDICVSFCISLFVVPVRFIAFNSNIKMGNIKVNPISSKTFFPNVRYVQINQGLFYGCFNACACACFELSSKNTISRFFDVPAFSGAVFLTSFCKGRGDYKIFFANWANQSDFAVLRLMRTRGATIFFLIHAFRWIKILFAILASSCIPAIFCFTCALFRTILYSGSSISVEGLAANRAFFRGGRFAFQCFVSALNCTILLWIAFLCREFSIAPWTLAFFVVGVFVACIGTVQVSVGLVGPSIKGSVTYNTDRIRFSIFLIKAHVYILSSCVKWGKPQT